MQSHNFQTVEMQILTHHIYEYKKGLRNLVLYTMSTEEKSKAETLLTSRGISCCFAKVSSDKVNLFFGDEVCIKIIQSFGGKLLILCLALCLVMIAFCNVRDMSRGRI